jgi:hypothetical protein
MISPKQFYLWASILIGLSVIFNLWNLFSSWSFMNLPSRLSFIFGNLLFQILLVVMFIGMWKVTPDMTLQSNPELDKMLEKISKEVK